ncbi:hypothetical protein AB6N35_09700 [Dietzia cinnamea]|uniref:Secreted protein n=1 Tax=Dietzia cinnamea TaxID=321318 RepID=A0ABV3YI23_9ACTN|nr:hypothetical protein [Dietzia cinnamea]MCT2097002.1 hypothetical protein [Dietzia cinnamea]MCT2174072.1 hypothetical protein [Dietzia cinnamea]
MTRSRLVAATALAAGLTVAAAPVASAATSTHAVQGTTVSATFTVEQGQLFDTCAALLAPSGKTPEIADRLTSGDLSDVVGSADRDPSVIALRAGALPVAAPTALGPATVRATDVPPNVYSLVTVCLSDRQPEITPFIMVGDPIAAVGGSLATLGEGDPVAAGSSLLEKAIAGGLF